MNEVLRLIDFGVSFRDRIVLDSVDMTVPARGVTALLGPGGVGKSTLLRTICGLNDPLEYMTVTGEATYLGRALEETNRPTLIAQRLDLTMSSCFEYLRSNLPERATLTHAQQRDVIDRILHHSGQERFLEHLSDNLLELDRTDRALLSIVRECIPNPRMLCVDEPTAGLDEQGAEDVLSLLMLQGERRSILFVTHNQRHAKKISLQAALLAGGRIIEQGPSSAFFSDPSSPITLQYIRTGGCSVPSPNARPEELDRESAEWLAVQRGVELSTEDEASQEEPQGLEEPTRPEQRSVSPTNTSEPLPAREWADASRGPRGFHWLEPGYLAGTPQPGIIYPIEQDLDALQRVGITTLVTLTETPVLENEALSSYDLTCFHFPIVDMHAPTVPKAHDFCQDLARRLSEGEIIALHCKAGLGRTGTMLAAYLVWQGMPAAEAIPHVREIEPRWIQSKLQEEFLAEFDTFCRTHHQPPAMPV